MNEHGRQRTHMEAKGYAFKRVSGGFEKRAAAQKEKSELKQQVAEMQAAKEAAEVTELSIRYLTEQGYNVSK